MSRSNNSNKQKVISTKFDYFDDFDDHEEQQDNIHINNLLDEEIDPLDAFMNEVELKVKEENISINNSKINNNNNPPEIISSNDFDDIDDYKETNTISNNNDSDDDRIVDDVDYDSDGIPILESIKRKPTTKEIIQPLPQIDHSTINYIKFRKNFFKEHSDIKAMSDEQINQIRKDLNVTLLGTDIPRPITEFNHSLFDKKLLFEIKQLGLYKPTPIQCQGIPIALSGRDMIGLANTGSGKTYAYIWPMIVHILDQPNLNSGEGPISLILAPTRELVTQIFNETKKFAKIYNINVCPVYGGAGKYEMSKALKSLPEIVIATPGFVKSSHSLSSVNNPTSVTSSYSGNETSRKKSRWDT
eukprot:gene19302-25163_t